MCRVRGGMLGEEKCRGACMWRVCIFGFDGVGGEEGCSGRGVRWCVHAEGVRG